MAGDADDRQRVTLGDYARVVWRRKWVVIGATVVLLGLALVYSFLKTPMYKASTTLIYDTPLNVSDPLSRSYVDSNARQLELNSVSSIIASPDLIASARKTLEADDIAVGYSVSAAPEVATSVSSGSTVLITAVSPSPTVAANAANAYAFAFTELRRSEQQEQVRQAVQVIRGQLESLRTEESRRSAEYFTLLQRLQDLEILEATVTGNFRVLVPATVPAAPFSPDPVRNGVMGLAAGLVLGIGLALLLEQFDTRVRTMEQVTAIASMPVLGSIHKLSRRALGDDPLAVLTQSRSPTAEDIRKVRGNLEFANVDGDLRSLVVTSALQHEGKSLTVCNLALSMAAAGRRVVLVDGDLRRPQVHKYLGLLNREGISTVLTGKSELRQAVRKRAVGPRLTTTRAKEGAASLAAGGECLNVLTTGPVPPNPAEVLASKSFASVIAELEEEFDLVIVDAPSVLAVGDTAAIARCVDGLILLVNLTVARRPLLEETVRQIGQMPCRKLGLVIVGNGNGHRYAGHYSYDHGDDVSLDMASGYGSLPRPVEPVKRALSDGSSDSQHGAV